MRRLVLLAAMMAAACSGETAPVSEEVAAAPVAEIPQCGLAPEQVGKFVSVPDGDFKMGANGVYPEEGPERKVHIVGFSIQSHEVTNRQFERFVTETNYVTDAERTSVSSRPDGGSGLFVQGEAGQAGQWVLKRGATWKTPEGPGSNLLRRMDMPVVHVSMNDAQAYATWADARLPTEEEWEYAAMLGMPDPADPTSGAYDPEGTPIANTWQGVFPVRNDVKDGFGEAAPAGCFPASRIGLYDMIGNVWEWTTTPFGPQQSTIKGGSFLCADNFCKRYRGAARQGQDIDFSSNHIGFRIVKDSAP